MQAFDILLSGHKIKSSVATRKKDGCKESIGTRPSISIHIQQQFLTCVQVVTKARLKVPSEQSLEELLEGGDLRERKCFAYQLVSAKKVAVDLSGGIRVTENADGTTNFEFDFQAPGRFAVRRAASLAARRSPSFCLGPCLSPLVLLPPSFGILSSLEFAFTSTLEPQRHANRTADPQKRKTHGDEAQNLDIVVQQPQRSLCTTLYKCTCTGRQGHHSFNTDLYVGPPADSYMSINPVVSRKKQSSSSPSRPRSLPLSLCASAQRLPPELRRPKERPGVLHEHESTPLLLSTNLCLRVDRD